MSRVGRPYRRMAPRDQFSMKDRISSVVVHADSEFGTYFR